MDNDRDRDPTGVSRRQQKHENAPPQMTKNGYVTYFQTGSKAVMNQEPVAIVGIADVSSEGKSTAVHLCVVLCNNPHIGRYPTFG